MHALLLQYEIEEMERELREGSTPTRGAGSAGTSPAPEFRVKSGVARRAMAPPVFRGASLRELRDFQQSCEVFFDAIEEQKNHGRGCYLTAYNLRFAGGSYVRCVRSRAANKCCRRRSDKKSFSAKRSRASRVRNLREACETLRGRLRRT
jgi:hypothetical protein